MTTLFDTIEKEIFNTVEKEIADKNYALGVEAGILKGYKRLENLMKNKNWTAEEAMDTLGYSEDEKDAYRKWSLTEKKVSEKVSITPPETELGRGFNRKETTFL